MPKRMKITTDFINQICDRYDDNYDDSVEDTSIGGTDWKLYELLDRTLQSFSGIHPLALIRSVP